MYKNVSHQDALHKQACICDQWVTQYCHIATVTAAISATANDA
jgi:hypothetical protein